MIRGRNRIRVEAREVSAHRRDAGFEEDEDCSILRLGQELDIDVRRRSRRQPQRELEVEDLADVDIGDVHGAVDLLKEERHLARRTRILRKKSNFGHRLQPPIQTLFFISKTQFFFCIECVDRKQHRTTERDPVKEARLDILGDIEWGVTMSWELFGAYVVITGSA